MKLDSKTVAALKLGSKTDLICFDSTLSGFGYRLRKGADGRTRRSWVVQYRRAGNTRRMLLGSAEVLTPDKARAAAREVLAKVALGQDPQGDRANRRESDKLTFAKAAAEFLESKQRHLRPRSFVEAERYLQGGYFKPLHALPLDTITRADVALRINTIERESGNATAGQARAKLSALFSWCMQEGLCGANPCIGTRKPVVNKPRERVLDDSELRAIWKAADDDGTEYGKIIKLQVLTGCRREEIGGMRWSEFSPDKSTWTLPAERSKNDHALTLPVLPMMRAILDTVPKMATREHLFGSHSRKGFGSWNHKAAFDERLAGQVRPWRLHDIRRTAATRMADIGVQPHIIEAVLNHQSGHKRGIAGVYNRSSYEREVRNALATWHDHVRSLLGGERKVVPLPRTAEQA